jgi:fumarate hydratase class II
VRRLSALWKISQSAEWPSLPSSSVLCESVIQVAAHVIGCDVTITLCGQTGNFELNVTMPIVTLKLLEAIEFTANVINAFTEKCVIGIQGMELAVRSWLEKASPWYQHLLH